MTWGMKGIDRKGSSNSTGRRVLRRRFGGRMAATFMAIAAMMMFALPAGALEPIMISTDTVIRGAEGDVFVLAEVSTGDEAGCEAHVSVASHNNPSVHVGNDLIVSSGGGSVVVSDVESEPGVVKHADGTLTLGDTVVVSLRLGPPDEGRPNSIFSGGLTVDITCVPVETTTSTTQPTTTTVTTPPTSGAVTTTTTAPSTSTSVLGTSTTTLPATTSVPPVSGSTLPFTGPGHLVGTGIAGAGLVLLGLALMMASRESRTTD